MLLTKIQIHSFYLCQELLQVWAEVGAHLWDSYVTLGLFRGYFEHSAERWEGTGQGRVGVLVPGWGHCAVQGQLEWKDLEIPINNCSRSHKRNSPSESLAAVGPAR